MATTNAARASLPRRSITYANERFPIGTYGTGALLFGLTALLTGGAIAGRPVEVGWSDLALLATVLLVFFHLRIMDELKDAETDAVVWPDRPVPRGLVTASELRLLGLGTIAIEVALNLALGIPTVGWYGLVLAFSALMYVEFWAGRWLRPRIAVYAATHMLILPLLATYVYASSALRDGAGFEPRFMLYLVLTYAAGCLLEVSRKVRAPGAELDGLDTFSKRFGVGRVSTTMVALALITGVAAGPIAAGIGPRWPFVVAIALLCLVSTVGILRFRACPTERRARRVAALYGPLCAVGVYVVLLAQILLRRGAVLSLL